MFNMRAASVFCIALKSNIIKKNIYWLLIFLNTYIYIQILGLGFQKNQFNVLEHGKKRL